MTEIRSLHRRRLMLMISTAFTGVAGAAGRAGAAPPPLAILSLVPGLSKTRRPVKPFLIPDYRNNPFLTPIGKQFTAAKRNRPTPGLVTGHGVDQ
jgi:hypothetical protein